MIAISGTPAQVRYAEGVRSQLARRFDDYDLPEISIPQFWIDSKDVRSIDELVEKAKPYIGVINTPFTAMYPRYNRQDAIAAVKALGDDYAILDLETTGLKRNQDEIVEISIVHASGKVLLDSLVRPLNTDQVVKAAVKGISKIELEHLEGAPTIDSIASRISDIVGSHHLVIYNSSFDIPFLQYQFLRYGLEVPTIQATCAMRIVAAYFNTDTNLSLERACSMLDVKQVEPAHRAYSDVMSTIGLLRAMVPVNNSRLSQFKERMAQVKLARK